MYTLGQAAKATGRSKSTILRALQTGKVSGSKNAHGQYEIDPAELHRVYRGTVQEERNDDARNSGATGSETAVLRAELDAIQRLAEERQRTIEDLRQRLDREGEERRKLTAMLTDQRPAPAPEPPKGFWRRVMGG